MEVKQSKVVHGVPYRLDVNRLKEAYPVPSLEEGRTITHNELAGVIDSDPKTQRYYGVVNSWIKETKKETGIFMVWDPGSGVKVLGPAEILNHAETRTRQKIGQTVRATKDYAWVPRHRLDQTGQQRLDNQTRVAVAIQNALKDAKKDMAIDFMPVRSLPKPKIVRDTEKAS